MTTTPTPTSGAADLPDAMHMAELLENPINVVCQKTAAAVLRHQHSEFERLHALAAGQATAAQPVLWVSPEQFANFMDADEAQFGKYVPARKTSAGNFTMPLFAARAPADSVQEDAARLDFLIEQRAYVVSDPDACPGYWLHWARPDGDTWVQIDKYPTPRAAIDAARKQEEKQ